MAYVGWINVQGIFRAALFYVRPRIGRGSPENSQLNIDRVLHVARLLSLLHPLFDEELLAY